MFGYESVFNTYEETSSKLRIRSPDQRDWSNAKEYQCIACGEYRTLMPKCFACTVSCSLCNNHEMGTNGPTLQKRS